MKKLITFAVAALALAACNKTEAPVVSGEGNPVRFTAKTEQKFVLKSVSKEDLDGKQVRIAADATLDNASSIATVNGEALDLATVIRWKAAQTEKTTFAGLYHNIDGAPAAPAAGLLQEYNMAGETYDYAYHEGFLTATAKDVTPETTVNLVFKHPFAKLTITVTKELEADIESVELRNVVLGGTLNLAEGTVINPAAPTKVAMVQNGTTNVYEAVIMPVAATPVIAVKIGEDTYKFAVSTETAFADNKNYTAAINIEDTTPTEGDPVGFTFEVVDWEDGEALETQEIVPVWSVIGKLNGDDWATDVVMTRTTAAAGQKDGVWEADITYAEGDEFKLRWDGEWDLSMGMCSSPWWKVYGLGDFEDGYLEAGSGNNIKLEATGNYHLVFTYPSRKFVVTAITPEP